MAAMTARAPGPTERTRLRRKADRGHYDRRNLDEILDEGIICHVGFAVDGRPWVFPTAYGRIDDRLYLHGASGNFGLRMLARGTEACVTVSLIDGLVFSRSAFHHSMNYRSVMIFGRAEAVGDQREKREALLAIVDHMAPGRAAATRSPSPDELRATLVVRLTLHEASAKVRRGGPAEEPADIGLPYWAGELPLEVVAREPLPDCQAATNRGRPVPSHVQDWSRRSTTLRHTRAGEQ
jgi:nitroimidazol reductase NimA-like FMN-containing flavoprotein (pyridoxamine 5'-phosphate oxidase superfamily)